MTNIKPPDDSLSSYFDDLLGGEEAQDLHASPAMTPAATNILVLPTKNFNKVADEQYTAAASINHASNQAATKSAVTSGTKQSVYKSTEKVSEKIPEPKTQNLRKTISELQDFAEPEPTQTREQKQKLEKLLQTARTQLLIAAPVEAKIEQQVETKPQTQAPFQSDPNEIQEWDVEATAATAIAPTLTPAIATTKANTTALAEPGIAVPVVTPPLVEPLITEPQIAEQIAPLPELYQLEGVDWLENGRPQWAQARFDVLLFQVSGLTLAVPLISLGQIQAITEELRPLFGQADWFMGFQLTPRGKISTVNTAKFVMPERYDASFVKTAKYVVSINGVPWGLAVDSVNQPISLNPDDVKWRTDRSKRPWLAGTVKDHMCALLDIPRIGQMLIDADKNFGRTRR